MLVAVSVIVMSSLGSSYAQDSGMSLTATAQDGSDTITVTGNTASTLNDVSILVEAPNKNVISVAQLSPDENGDFGVDIKISDALWKQDGFYTITAQQGDSALYKLSVKVQVMGGTTFSTDVTQSTFENTLVGQKGPEVTMDGLTIRADWEKGNPIVPIVGSTDRMQFPITLTVKAPNGNVISVDQVSPSITGSFEAEVVTGCESWEQDGDYTVTAQQGDNPNYKDTAIIPVAECVPVPEFGTIAALILAVAIISIIAVSARSRLSIMPKY